ncbi:MAG: hypothetical protein QOH41_2408 [Blastocatellia bacterium]|nr:hypothetical protein [Blastocatellia bacterium]
MNGKECRATRREIDESELNQTLSDQARVHAGSCGSCRDFRAERIALRELVGSLEPVAAPGDFELRLRARLANERQSGTRQPFIFRFVIGAPAIAAAALIVVLALSLAWFTQRKTSQSPAIASRPIQPAPAISNPHEDKEKVRVPEQTAAINPVVGEVRPAGRLNRNAGAYRGSGIASGSGISASDYGASPAESIKQIEQRAGEVSLSAPFKPMVVSMQDDRGETRRISLPPVSFGAQRLVDNRIPVSATNSRSW